MPMTTPTCTAGINQSQLIIARSTKMLCSDYANKALAVEPIGCFILHARRKKKARRSGLSVGRQGRATSGARHRLMVAGADLRLAASFSRD
jgi:hypothetical protein